jgi:ankyrin repeat protein
MSKSFETIVQKIMEGSDDESVLALISSKKVNKSIFTESDENSDTLLHFMLKVEGKYYKQSALKLIKEVTAKDLLKENAWGSTALHWASKKGYIKVVTALIEKNRKILEVKNNKKESPLHWAAEHGKFNIIKLLIEKRYSLIEQKDHNNETALHWAAKYGKLDATKHLLEAIKQEEKSKFIGYTNTDAETALDLAIEKGHRDIVQLLSYHNDSKCFLNLDDSSDREDTVEGYDVSKKFKEFVDNNKEKSPFDGCNNFILSFITHAAGIYLFYSPQVQAKYYGFKDNQLRVENKELLK